MIEQFKQNEIEDLEELGIERYENIFNVYNILKGDDESFLYYNILRKVSIDTNNADPNIFDYVEIRKPIPWTILSNDRYGTQHLWWLILAANNISNPLELPKTGNTYKVIKKEFIGDILQQLL